MPIDAEIVCAAATEGLAGCAFALISAGASGRETSPRRSCAAEKGFRSDVFAAAAESPVISIEGDVGVPFCIVTTGSDESVHRIQQQINAVRRTPPANVH